MKFKNKILDYKYPLKIRLRMSRTKTSTAKASQDYDSMKVTELKALCKKRDVSSAGTKADIVTRLENNDSKGKKKVVKDVSEDSESEVAPARSSRTKKPVKKTKKEVSEPEDSSETEEPKPKVSGKKTKEVAAKRAGKKVPTKKSVKEESDAESEEPVKHSKKTVKKPVKEESDAESEEPVKPSKKPVKKTVKEVSDESEEPTKPAKKPVKKTVKKTVKAESEPDDQESEEPVKKSTKKNVKKPVKKESDCEESVEVKKPSKKAPTPEESEEETIESSASESEEQTKKSSKKTKEEIVDEDEKDEGSQAKENSEEEKKDDSDEDTIDAQELVADPNAVYTETDLLAILKETAGEGYEKLFLKMKKAFAKKGEKPDEDAIVQTPDAEFVVNYNEDLNAYVRDGYVYNKQTKSAVGKVVDGEVRLLEDSDVQKLGKAKIRVQKVTNDELDALLQEGEDDGEAVTRVENDMKDLADQVDTATEEMFGKILKAQASSATGDLPAIAKKSGVNEDICKDVLTRIQYYSNRYPKQLVSNKKKNAL